MTINEILTNDGRKVASVLADKLPDYETANAVIIAIPDSGLTVAYHLSKVLKLPVDILPCRNIKHPADGRRSIASVTLDEIVTHHESFDMPQDYLYHQIAMTRYCLQAQWDFYKDSSPPVPLTGKTVILVDDHIADADTMIASVRSIRKQRPQKLIVAVHCISPEAMFALLNEPVEIVSVHLRAGRPVCPDRPDDLNIAIDETQKELFLQVAVR